MRSRAALLLAVLAVMVIGASVVVTSHFGMQDWPTPPLPDTATRLISPTEAVGRISDLRPGRDDSSGRRIVDARTGQTGPPERRGRAGQSRRGEHLRQRASRRGDGRARRSGGRPQGRTQDSGDSSPALQPSPLTGTPDRDDEPKVDTPAAPGATPVVEAPTIDLGAVVAPAGSGGQSQARSHGPAPSEADEDAGDDDPAGEQDGEGDSD